MNGEINMNEKEIQHQIENLIDEELEKTLPAADIQLWPVIHKSLSSWTEVKETPHKRREGQILTMRLRPVLAVGMLVLILLVGVLTPRGRVLAQNIYGFFTRVSGLSFKLSVDQIPDEDPSLAPTGSETLQMLSIEEAEILAGFQTGFQPQTLEGLTYLGAQVDGNTITFEYQTQDTGGSLAISISQEGYHQSAWNNVPEREIVQVQIGDQIGEYVEGMYVVFSGDDEATWNPNAPLTRLRWQENGFWLEISKFGEVEAIEYLDITSLIDLATSLNLAE
jgi:hypothetical protein